MPIKNTAPNTNTAKPTKPERDCDKVKQANASIMIKPYPNLFKTDKFSFSQINT